MKIIINTNTLKNAISLGIISNNINRFDHKSTLAQISADEDYLAVTLESNLIHSQIKVVGQCLHTDEEKEYIGSKRFVKLVDASTFKQLALTFDTEETEIEFMETGIELHSGNSKFSVAQIIDSEDMMLSSPDSPQEDDKELEFNKDDWDFIKNHQLFAVSKVFTRPVYTYIYTDSDGNVIAGDMDNALFTLSKKLNLNRTCLLSDKIINLFNTVPSGTKLVEHDDGFIMTLEGEGFTYLSEFRPKYEDESDIGEYNADMFLSMMKIPSEGYCSFEPSLVSKFLSQVSLMSKSLNEAIKFNISGTEMILTNRSSNNSKFAVGGDCPDFEMIFRLSSIKEVIANYNSEEVNMYPLKNSDGELAGILVWDNDLVTMLAGVED